MSALTLVLVGIAVFFVGLLVVLFRRSTVVALMGLEMMLGAGNLVLIGGFRAHPSADPQAAVALFMALAAAEVAIGMAIVVLAARHGARALDDLKNLMKED